MTEISKVNPYPDGISCCCAGMAEPAAQFTWIFTSILSSEDLLKIEPLLSRTKVNLVAKNTIPTPGY
jgi:hypothetical protein